jgi:D-3-phosphoglycerate dehydrogenase
MGAICITTSQFDVEGNEQLRRLMGRGWIVHPNPWRAQLDEARARAFVGEHDPAGVIAGIEPWTRAVMAAAPSLRCISRVGVGVDAIDFEAARERAIEIRSTPDSPAPAVAELTIGLILSLLRQIPLQDRRIRAGEWVKEAGPLLAGKTVAVIGCGRIGRRVADLCLAFGAQPCPYDPVTAPGDLDAILAGADIVTLHLPLSPEVRHLMDAKRIGRMKPSAYLVNASRGGLVDEAALYAALTGGQLAGAALDVFEEEPYSGPLRELANVVLTPHIGSAANEVRRRMEAEAAANLAAVLEAGEAAWTR